MTAVETYIETLTNLVYDQIEKHLDGKNDAEIIDEHFTQRLKKKKFENFQVYYSKTLKQLHNINFQEFKQKYSLQFIDKDFTQLLEKNKHEIASLIHTDKLAD